MPFAKLRYGAEVWLFAGRHRLNVEPLQASPGDPTRTVDALRVAIEQKRGHHRRVKCRRPARVVIGSMDRRQVQAVANQVADKMARMLGRNEILYRRRQQKDLIHIPRTISFAHATSESEQPIHVRLDAQIVDGLLAEPLSTPLLAIGLIWEVGGVGGDDARHAGAPKSSSPKAPHP
jgi:hypothetical protein